MLPDVSDTENQQRSDHGLLFCKYAYFGLENKVVLEVGICRWPEVQLE